MTRLVLFDIDGTLLSAQGAPRRAFHRALFDVYGTAGPIDGHTFDGKTDPQIARELLVLAGLTNAAVDEGLARLWSTYLRHLARELTLPDQQTLVAAQYRLQHPGIFSAQQIIVESVTPACMVLRLAEHGTEQKVG